MAYEEAPTNVSHHTHRGKSRGPLARQTHAVRSAVHETRVGDRLFDKRLSPPHRASRHQPSASDPLSDRSTVMIATIALLVRMDEPS